MHDPEGMPLHNLLHSTVIQSSIYFDANKYGISSTPKNWSYDAEADTWTCTADQKLVFRYKSKNETEYKNDHAGIGPAWSFLAKAEVPETISDYELPPFEKASLQLLNFSAGMDIYFKAGVQVTK